MSDDHGSVGGATLCFYTNSYIDLFMRIGIFSRWNATCGVSLHAELIGREFIKKGHEIYVFAPYVQSANLWWHHKIIKDDEPFVIRCYEEMDPNFKGGRIDEEKILERDFDLFIVESYTSIPYRDVKSLVKKLDCTKVVVIHEGGREDLRYTDLNVFDYIVIFDERYYEIVGHSEKVRIIPYPCNPVKKGKRKFAEDILTFISFGRQPVNEYEDYIKALDRLSERYEFVYKIFRSDGLLPFERDWLRQENKRIKAEELYDYLHTADIHLLPKGNTNKIVVSSTLFQCLGSLIPTVVPNTRHFETVDRNAVVIYTDVDDLEGKLIRLVEDDEFRNKVIKAAERFVERNSVEKIAERFLDLK